MQRPKNVSSTFQRPVPEVLHAALGVVQQGDYDLVALSHDHARLLFSTHKTLMSFERELIGEVRATEQGASLDLVCGMIDGKPMGLIDGRKNRKFAEAFATAVGEVLDGTRSAPVTPVDSFWTLADGTRAPWNGTDLPQVWPSREA